MIDQKYILNKNRIFKIIDSTSLSDFEKLRMKFEILNMYVDRKVIDEINFQTFVDKIHEHEEQNKAEK
jgi:hypothetical protein